MPTLKLNPWYLTLLFMVVVLLKLGQVLLQENLSWCDLQDQVVGTQQLLAGHGVSAPFVSPIDLSQVQYRPIVQWPAGYSYVLAPFLAFFSPVWSVVMLNLLSLLCFFTGYYLLTKALGPWLGLKQVIWLTLLGLSLSPMLYLFSSDLLGVSLLMLLLGLVGQTASINGGNFWLRAFMLGILAFLIAFCRTAYLPCSLVLLVGLSTYGWYFRLKRPLKIGAISIVIMVLMVSIQTITKPFEAKGVSDSFSFGTVLSRAQVADPQHPYHPTNLQYFRAQDLSKGLFDDRIVYTTLKYVFKGTPQATKSLTTTLTQLIGFITAGLAIVLTCWILWSQLPLFRARKIDHLNAENRNRVAALMLALLLGLMLMSVGIVAWASFTRPMLREGAQMFTFLKSERYYIVMMVGIPILLAAAHGYLTQNGGQGWFPKTLSVFAIALVALNLAYLPVAIIGQIRGTESAFSLGDPKLKYLPELQAIIKTLTTKGLITQPTAAPVAYWATNAMHVKTIVIAGASILPEGGAMTDFRTSKPVWLLISMDKTIGGKGQKSGHLVDAMAKNVFLKTQVVMQNDDFDLYACLVVPASR